MLSLASTVHMAVDEWFIMENPIKMDDLGEPRFSETSIYGSWMFLELAISLEIFKRKNAEVGSQILFRDW